MFIDRFYKDDGYYDECGCFYETAEDFYQTKVFGFCGCGHPNGNLEYVRDGLAHIGKERPENMGQEEHSRWFDQWVNEGLEIFGNEKSRYFFFYWCDTNELTEHGGSVPGWLTEKGKQALSDLREICSS